MATPHVRAGGTVTLDSVNLSDRIEGVEVRLMSGEVMAGPTMGQPDQHVRRLEGGPRDAEVAIDWQGDYAAGSVFETLRAKAGEVVPMTVQPADGLDTVTVDVHVSDAPFITGRVGELAAFSTGWMSAGNWSIAPAPPSTPIWHTTLRVGAAGGDRGMDRESPNMWGRLTDDDVVIGSRTVTIWRLRVNGSSGNVQLGTDHRDDLHGKWLMVDGQVMEIDFGTATGNGQHTHTPGWSALTTGDLVSVSLWDRDPTGTSWTATTAPHKLWSTTMTAADASNTTGYNATTSQGSLDDAEISTPDGDQTLSRFRWAAGVLDVRMATAAEAALMFDLWWRFQVGDGTWVQTQISDITSTVLRLTPNPYTDNPNWLDGQAVTVEIWDQNPSN